MVQSISRTCAWCGAVFQQAVRRTGGGRPAKYCSVEHRAKAGNARPGRGIAGPRSWPHSADLLAEVCDLYLSGLSAESVGLRFGRTSETVRRALRGNGIVLRNRNAPTAAKRFKNGRVRVNGGYVGTLLRPDDPLYSMAWKNAQMKHGAYAPEHRVIMARALGRPLEDWENVHHKNGIRDDNRPENLELWITAQPSGQRPEDLVSWVVYHYPDLAEAEVRRRKREKRTGQDRLIV